MFTQAKLADPKIHEKSNDERHSRSKLYRELEIGDEINAFCGGRYKRCRVTGLEDQGDIVRLKLEPITKATKKDPSILTFKASATCEQFDPDSEPSERHSEMVMGAIAPGQLMTPSELSDLLLSKGLALPTNQITKICKQLVSLNLLKERRIKNRLHYRRSLPKIEGLAVVELAGTRSERLGWIVEWKIFCGGLEPLVRWIDGSGTSFSTDHRLDPAKGEQLKQIQKSKEL